MSALPFLNTHSGDIGVVQYFWGPIALGVFILAIVLAVRRPSRREKEVDGARHSDLVGIDGLTLRHADDDVHGPVLNG